MGIFIYVFQVLQRGFVDLSLSTIMSQTIKNCTDLHLKIQFGYGRGYTNSGVRFSFFIEPGSTEDITRIFGRPGQIWIRINLDNFN